MTTTAAVPIDQDPVYVALLGAADTISKNAADLRRHNKSLSVQIIVGAMEGAAAIVRAVAHDRLCELANATGPGPSKQPNNMALPW